MQTDILIIGAGPTGLFTAFEAGMLGMKVIIVDALDAPGGQCAALYPHKPIYDIPAYPEISAQELIDQLLLQIKPFDNQILLNRQIISMKEQNSDGKKIFTCLTSNGEAIESKAIVIAAGAGAFGPNRPPLENIEKYEGKSVLYSVKDKEKLSGKTILIAGGGDSAVDWAIELSKIANVSIVHRREKFRAAPASVSKMNELVQAGKINLITNYQLEAIIGDEELKQIIIKDLQGNTKAVDCDILLPFFGLSQDLGPIQQFGLSTTNNYINVTWPNFETTIEGVYAVGDVAKYQNKLKLILTGFAESASAMHHVYSRVFDGKALHFEYSTSKGIK